MNIINNVQFSALSAIKATSPAFSGTIPIPVVLDGEWTANWTFSWPTLENIEPISGTTTISVKKGCTNSAAYNYCPECNVYGGQAPVSVTGGSSTECITAIYGCMNPTALNYYPGANVDDGSCICGQYGASTPC